MAGPYVIDIIEFIQTLSVLSGFFTVLQVPDSQYCIWYCCTCCCLSLSDSLPRVRTPVTCLLPLNSN